MKYKNLMLLAWPLMVLLALTSCEKVNFDDNDDSPSSSVPADANLILKVATKGTRGEDVPWTTLNFVVYQAGKKLKSVTQHIDDEQFGEVGLKLTPGTYQVMVLAHSSLNPSLSDPTNVKFDNKGGFSDTFGAYTDIVVSETPQTHEISLSRYTAMVRFKTKDAKPAAAKMIRFYYTGGSGAINLVSGYGVDASKQSIDIDLPDSLNGKTLQFELYTFPRTDDAKLKLLVSIFNNNGTLINYPSTSGGIKTIENIPIKRNQITECSGYFFTNGSGNSDDTGGDDSGDDNNDNTDENSDASFTIVVDTEWDGETNYDY